MKFFPKKQFINKMDSEQVKSLIETTILRWNDFDPTVFKKNININLISEYDRNGYDRTGVADALIETSKHFQLDLVCNLELDSTSPGVLEKREFLIKRLKETLQLAVLYGSVEAFIIATQVNIVLENESQEHHHHCMII